MAAVIPQPFLVDIAFQVYYNINQNLPQHPCGVIGENPFEKGLFPEPLS